MLESDYYTELFSGKSVLSNGTM